MTPQANQAVRIFTAILLIISSPISPQALLAQEEWEAPENGEGATIDPATEGQANEAASGIPEDAAMPGMMDDLALEDAEESEDENDDAEEDDIAVMEVIAAEDEDEEEGEDATSEVSFTGNAPAPMLALPTSPAPPDPLPNPPVTLPASPSTDRIINNSFKMHTDLRPWRVLLRDADIALDRLDMMRDDLVAAEITRLDALIALIVPARAAYKDLVKNRVPAQRNANGTLRTGNTLANLNNLNNGLVSRQQFAGWVNQQSQAIYGDTGHLKQWQTLLNDVRSLIDTIRQRQMAAPATNTDLNDASATAAGPVYAISLIETADTSSGEGLAADLMNAGMIPENSSGETLQNADAAAAAESGSILNGAAVADEFIAFQQNSDTTTSEAAMPTTVVEYDAGTKTATVTTSTVPMADQIQGLISQGSIFAAAAGATGSITVRVVGPDGVITVAIVSLGGSQSSPGSPDTTTTTTPTTPTTTPTTAASLPMPTTVVVYDSGTKTATVTTSTVPMADQIQGLISQGSIFAAAAGATGTITVKVVGPDGLITTAIISLGGSGSTPGSTGPAATTTTSASMPTTTAPQGSTSPTSSTSLSMPPFGG